MRIMINLFQHRRDLCAMRINTIKFTSLFHSFCQQIQAHICTSSQVEGQHKLLHSGTASSCKSLCLQQIHQHYHWLTLKMIKYVET